MDGYLYQSLIDVNEFVKKDWDGIGFIVGYEGDGKSTFAQQIALFLDRDFSLDKIVFTSEQFEQVVEVTPLKDGSHYNQTWEVVNLLGNKNGTN